MSKIVSPINIMIFILLRNMSIQTTNINVLLSSQITIIAVHLQDYVLVECSNPSFVGIKVDIEVPVFIEFIKRVEEKG